MKTFNAQTVLKSAILVIVLASAVGYLFLRKSDDQRDFDLHKGPLRASFLESRAYVLPLNNPDVVPVDQATHMADDDIVFGIVVSGHARAYPRWIMVAYHIANDTIDEHPVMIVQCEICSSVAAFTATVESIQVPLNFEPCGYRLGTFEICDTLTRSRWTTFAGISYAGHLKDKTMSRIPVVIQTWKDWKTVHPKTDVVFATQNLKKRPHGRGPETEIGHPYIPDRMKRTADFSDTRLHSNTLVYGIYDKASKQSVTFPLDILDESGKPLLYEFQGNRYLVVRYGKFAISAFVLPHDKNQYHVSGLHPLLIIDEHGGQWDASGDPIIGSKKSIHLECADGYFAEYYEWINAHPHATLASLAQAEIK